MKLVLADKSLPLKSIHRVMKRLLLIPLLLGFSVSAIAHNEANGGDADHLNNPNEWFGGEGAEPEEGEYIKNWNKIPKR